MARFARRLCTQPFKIRVEPTPSLPELSTAPAKTLIRETSTTIRQLLTSHPRPVILRGPKGVGKSSLLAQAVAQAREKGTIVLYLPDARVWTHGGGFFAASALADRQPHLEGPQAVRFYDRPKQMEDVFKHLLEAHGEQLKEIPCTPDRKSAVTEACADLKQLVQLGYQLLQDVDNNWRMHPEHAGTVMSQLIEELLASQHPTAIMIDNYTALTGLTCMTNERKHRLHAESIRLIAEHLGRRAIESTADRLNGPVVLAAETRPAFEEWRASRVCAGTEYSIDEAIRRDPSGRHWWKGLVKRVEADGLLVDVPPLEGHEQRAMCATFPGGRDRANDRLIALAGGRADAMRRIYATR